MPCKDCYNNCSEIHPDRCITYTGEDIPLLDVCTGEPISKLQEALVEKLLSALDGTGITPSEVTLENCDYVKGLLGVKDPTLTNLLQILIDNQCTLNEALVELQEGDTTVSFDKKCLEGTTRDSLLQAAINKICTINTTVGNFPTTYVKTTDLKNQVITIVKEEAGGTTQYKDRAIPHVAYEYYGSLSNFDNTGKGISTLGFEKIFLCNGLNGTPDRRGRTGVGAIANVPGGTLDAAVDPANANNPNTNYALKDKFGESFHKQTVSELPTHTHEVIDPGHSHSYLGYEGEKRPGGNNVDRDDKRVDKTTGDSKTGISIASTGSSQAFNVRQPSIAAYYIMYIP